MDSTERKIPKLAREANRFTVQTMKEDGIGTAEMDVIHFVRHNPGTTQKEMWEALKIDKGATARQLMRLEAKGYVRREPNPADRRSRLLYATEKADELKDSRAHLEELFYQWLMEPLTPGEREELARLLAALEPRCMEERRNGFPNVKRLLAQKQRDGGEPA